MIFDADSSQSANESLTSNAFSSSNHSPYGLSSQSAGGALDALSSPVAGVDLTVLAFDVRKDHLLQGQTDVIFTLKNQGTLAADSFDINILYSNDDELGNGDDIVVGTFEIAGLEPDELLTQTVSVQLPVDVLNANAQAEDAPNQDSGYVSNNVDFLGIRLDAGNEIAESNEENNLNLVKGQGIDDVTYFPWDIDGNGVVTPTDAIFTINRVSQSVPDADARADFDGNGLITPTDAIAAINRLGYAINPAVSRPVIRANLANDTGFSSTDRITVDPTISGIVADATSSTILKAGFGDTPAADFVDITADLLPDGRFELSAERLEEIFGDAIAAGLQILHLVVEDGQGNIQASLDFSFSLDEQITLIPGQRGAIDLKALIPDSEDATFGLISESTLPTGELSADGVLRLTPAPEDIGTFEIAVVVTENGADRTFPLEINIVADPITTTRVSGIIENTDQEPLANVVIGIGNVTTMTASDGSFTLEFAGALPSDTLRIEPGQQVNGIVYPSIAEKLPLVLEHEVYDNVNNIIDRPVYLPPIDIANAVTIDPTVNTTVTTETIPGASVFVSAGSLESMSGELYTEQLSITEVPRELTPAALPDNLLPDLVITVQPGEMVFTQPAPLSLPNRAGYAPGTEMDLWSINPETGDFDNVGVGRVSANGSVVNTISGGIRTSSWHFFAPPPPAPSTPSTRNPNNNCQQCKASGGFNSEVEFHSGGITDSHDLVTYQSLGETRGISLSYQSLRADPRPIVHFGYDNVLPTANQVLEAQLTLRRGDFQYTLPGGDSEGRHYWSAEATGSIDAALQANIMQSLPTGMYDYDLTTGLLILARGAFFSGVFGTTVDSITLNGSRTSREGQILHVNTVDSVFGSGWGIDGLQEIVENPDGSVLLVDGGGEELFFEKLSDGYDSPPGDFSTLEKLADGTFRRTLKDQTVYAFNAQNRLVEMRDRNSNTTQYIYNQDSQITKIVDPVGLETAFTYSGQRVTTITDPVGRVTELTYDNDGNLTEIKDPDGSKRTFEYDDQHHMVAETDQRGNREQSFYDFAGRATKAILKDGAEVLVNPAQVQGLYEPRVTAVDIPVGIYVNRPLPNLPGLPSVFQIGTEAITTYTDANGDTITYTLDQAGQIISAADEIGELPISARNDENLLISSTNARGNASFFTYDDRGNLLTTWDETLAQGGIISGSISLPGETDAYQFSLTERSLLYIDSLTNSSDLFWSLIGPRGQEITNRRLDFNDAVLDLVAGDYTLTIDGFSDATGDYEFRLKDLQQAAPVSLGSPISGQLSSSRATDLYQFELTAGDSLSFTGEATANGNNIVWQLIDPLGNTLFNQNFNGTTNLQLVFQSGTYTLLIAGRNSNADGTAEFPYTFTIEQTGNTPPPIVAGEALTLGTTISEPLGANEEAVYSFTLDEPSLLLFDALQLESFPSARWTLTGPAGIALGADSFFSSNSFEFELIDAVAGDYTLTVSEQIGVAGTVNFRLLALEQAEEITPGTPFDGTVATAGTKLYRFEADAGEQFFFDAQETTVVGGSLGLRLLDPYGSEVFFNSSFSTISDVDTTTLTQSGTYTLLVESRSFTPGSATFKINVQPVLETTPETLNLGVATNGSIENIGETAVYTFTLSDRSLLYFDALSNTNDFTISLTGPAGTEIATIFFPRPDASLIDAVAGTYTLTVDGIGDNTGAFDFKLSTLEQATELTPGTPIDGELKSAATDLYRFEGTAGDSFFLDLSNLFSGDVEDFRVIDPFGNVVERSVFTSRITLSQTGTYTLLVEGTNFGTTPSAYTLNVQPVSDITETLTVGVTTSGSIDTSAQEAIYTFTLNERSLLFFDSLTNNDDLRVTLTGPAGIEFSNIPLLYSNNLSRRVIPIDAAPGDYTLTVRNRLNQTGAFDFRLWNADQASELTLGTPMSGTIEQENIASLYRFDAAVGDQFMFDVQASSGDISGWLLVDPYGNTVFSDSFGDRPEAVSLDYSGSYTLLVEGSGSTANPSSYTFNVELVGNEPPPPPAGNPLTLNAPISDTINGTTGEDLYHFEVSERGLFYFDSLSLNRAYRWALTGPASRGDGGSFNSSDRYFELLPGTHTLSISKLFDTTFPYEFQLLSLAEAQLITASTPADSKLSPGQETEVYRFIGEVGDRILLNTEITSIGGSVRTRLIDPIGNQLATIFPGGAEPITLTQSGTYAVLIEGTSSNNAGPDADYSFSIQSVAETVPESLTLSDLTTGSIDNPGEENSYTFTLSEQSLLYFDPQTNSSEFSWALVGPAGEEVSMRSFDSSFNNRILDLVPGDYTLTIDGSGSRTGSYQFRLTDLADASQLMVGTPVGDTLSPTQETDFYQFTGVAGERLYFDVLTSNNMGSASWRLLDPYGNFLQSGSGFNDAFEPVTLTQDGTYIVQIMGQLNNSGGPDGEYSFNLQPLDEMAPRTLLIEESSGSAREFTYDDIFNQVTSVMDELGRLTLFEIDETNGNILSETKVVGEIGGNDDLVTQFTYTAQGLIDLQTDPLGRVTDFDYDVFGRVVDITYAKDTADEATEKFEYDTQGNVIASVDENNNRTEFEYDELNRVELIRDALNNETVFGYDEAGNLTTTTDALGNVTRNEYDVLDRVKRTIDALEQETVFEYDNLNNITSVTDPLGNVTQNLYDARSRLIQTTDAEGGVTQFGYDLDDNLNKVTDAENNVTEFTYDARNRLIEEIDPLDNSTAYTYDAVDNLVAKTDRNGRETSFAYDELDRVVSETWIGDGNVVEYAYDKGDNLLSVKDQFSELTYTYDERGRVLITDNSGTPNAPNVVLSYTYDDVGNVLTTSDTINGTAGGTNTYSYDALNRVTRLTQSGNGVSDKRVDFDYNAVGQFETIDRYADLVGTQLVTGTTYSYDDLNQLTGIAHNDGTTDIAFYDLAYDKNNRIKSIVDVDGATDYTYDDTNQLLSADHTDPDNPDETYTYDDNGNRISSSLHGENYETGPGNRLLSDGTYSYTYDDEGNLIEQTEIATGATRQFQWDYRNRLIGIVDRDASEVEIQRVEFVYDALDRRIVKEVDITPQDNNDGTATHFIYDGSDVLLDFVDSDGESGADEPELEKRYLHGPVVDQVLAQEDTEGNALWHLSDHLGTVRDLVSSSGAVVNHYTYDSYGNVINETNFNVENRYLFTGRELDSETGLYYYRARYYDPLSGRFIGEDPIGFSSGDFNLSLYALNNPISFVDPLGTNSNPTGVLNPNPLTIPSLAGGGINCFLTRNGVNPAIAGILAPAIAGAIFGARVFGGPGAVAGAVGGIVGSFIGIPSSSRQPSTSNPQSPCNPPQPKPPQPLPPCNPNQCSAAPCNPPSSSPPPPPPGVFSASPRNGPSIGPSQSP